MIKVEFLGPIQKDSLEIQAQTLHDVADALKDDAEVSDWLKSCAVAVNDTLVKSLDTVLKDGDKVSLLPPVCGG